jgi:hypothetical protein
VGFNIFIHYKVVKISPYQPGQHNCLDRERVFDLNVKLKQAQNIMAYKTQETIAISDSFKYNLPL